MKDKVYFIRLSKEGFTRQIMDFCYSYPRFSYGFPDLLSVGCRNSFFEDFIGSVNRKQLERQRYEKELEERRNTVNHVRELEDSKEFRIHIFKGYGGFKGYEVKVVRSKAGAYVLKIFGNDDKFERHYILNEDVVDLSKVHWNMYNEGTTLVLRLPKLQNLGNAQKLQLKIKKHDRMRKSKEGSHKNKRKHESKADHRNTHEEDNNQESGHANDSEEFRGFDDEGDKHLETTSGLNDESSRHDKPVSSEDIEMSQDLKRNENSATSSASASETEYESAEPLQPASLHKTYSPTLEEVEDEEWTKVVA